MHSKVGTMRYRLDIKTFIVQTDADAFQTRVPTTLATVWAAIQPTSAREFFLNQQGGDEVNSKITIRHCADLTGDMTLECGDRRFDIVSILPDARTGYDTIMAREVTAHGEHESEDA